TVSVMVRWVSIGSLLATGAVRGGAQRAAGEDARQVPTVIGGRLQIGVGLDRGGHLRCQRVQARFVGPLSAERAFSQVAGVERAAADAGQGESGTLDASVRVQRHRRGDADDGEVSGTATELLEAGAGAGRPGRKLHRDEQLVRAKGGGEVAEEEVVRGEGALAG